MRKTFISIVLLSVLGSIAVSCQKEKLIDQTAFVSETRTIYYTIDGVSYTISLKNEDAWREFLEHLFALAEEGHIVTFRNEVAISSIATPKDTVKYNTTNKDDAYAWSEKMNNAGYFVTISYDKEKGVYNCIAIR